MVLEEVSTIGTRKISFPFLSFVWGNNLGVTELEPLTSQLRENVLDNYAQVSLLNSKPAVSIEGTKQNYP